MAEGKKQSKETKVRVKEIPKYKIKQVKDLAEKMENKKTFLIASTKGLPSSQFQDIKKKLRGKAEVGVAKKSIIIRAIDSIEKGSLKRMKEQIGSDIALFFSDIDAFELSGLLADNRSPTKAKAGDIAPEDIEIEPGPTELIPGPAISELSNVGLKVIVKEGKLSIKKGAVVAKKGEEIDANVAGVLGKLNIAPMNVGFEPLAAYDSKEDKVYIGIKVDKESALEFLRESIGKSLGFAIGIDYTTKETVAFFISKAGAEEKILGKFGEKQRMGARNLSEEFREKFPGEFRIRRGHGTRAKRRRREKPS